MSTITTEQAQSFVESLELPAPPPFVARMELGAPQITEGQKSAFVNGGSLTSFVSDLTAQHQSDVLNSTLLAQLAANKKFDREEQTVEWYKFYRNVLENVGWVIQAFDFTKFKASGATFTVDKVVLDLLASIASENEMEVVHETLHAFEALADEDNRLRIFDDQSHSLDKGNFQIAVASESGGVVAMKMAAFHFTTSQHVTRVLWFGFSSSKTDLYHGAQQISLNEEIYGQVRSPVVDKLGENAHRFIHNLEI